MYTCLTLTVFVNNKKVMWFGSVVQRLQFAFFNAILRDANSQNCEYKDRGITRLLVIRTKKQVKFKFQTSVFAITFVK